MVARKRGQGYDPINLQKFEDFKDHLKYEKSGK